MWIIMGLRNVESNLVSLWSENIGDGLVIELDKTCSVKLSPENFMRCIRVISVRRK